MKGALVVGIDHYNFQSSLSGCVSDAEKFSKLLKTNEDGTKNFDVKLVTSSSDNKITRPFLKDKIKQLFAVEGDAALLYFSGHGTENDLGGYLVTQDAVKFDEGVPLSDILTLANNSKSKETIIIIDSCFSGHMGNAPEANNKAIIKAGLTIMTASRADQKAYESSGTGVFTSLLLEGLQGGAADLLGKISIASLFNYAEQALGFFDQRPLFKSHVSQLITIRKCDPQIPLTVLAKLPEYFQNQNSKHQLAPTYESTCEKCIEEHSLIFRDLQKCRGAGLVMPIGYDHMYDAAMESGFCKLTAQGKYYWYLAKEQRI